MCTVTRPGVALFAAASAVELLASVLQHPKKSLAPPYKGENNISELSSDDTLFENPLSTTPHQLRGFLHNFEAMKIWGPSYERCSACSVKIVDAWKYDGWEFVKQALDNPEYVSELSGLADLQRQTEELELDGLDWTSGSDDIA